MRFFSSILKIEVRGSTPSGVTPRAENFGQRSLTYWDNDIENQLDVFFIFNGKHVKLSSYIE
jgi:hypothetical protein